MWQGDHLKQLLTNKVVQYVKRAFQSRRDSALARMGSVTRKWSKCLAGRTAQCWLR